MVGHVHLSKVEDDAGVWLADSSKVYSIKLAYDLLQVQQQSLLSNPDMA